MPTIFQYIKSKKTDQKRICINNFDDFKNVIGFFQKANNFVYRGISSHSQYYPSLIRYNDLTKEEFAILEELEHNSVSYPNPIYYHWDLIAMAQHYGKPTRLLDFTYDISVAFFFSLFKEMKDNECKYEIYVLEKSRLISPTEIKESSLSDVMRKYRDSHLKSNYPYTEKIKKELTISMRYSFLLLPSHYSNPRILAQKGLFVIVNNLNKQIINDFYETMPYVIEISADVRKKILSHLKKSKYDEKNLMF